jgi:hypothetical protein
VISVVFPVEDSRLGAVEVVDADLVDLEEDLASGGETRIDEVFLDFVLGVDDDRFSAGQVLKIDAMAAARELQFDAAVDQALRPHALAYADFGEQVGGALLENSGAHTLFYIGPALGFQDYRFDAIQIKDVGE